MDKYTAAVESGKAYYCNSISGFIEDNPETIIGRLSTRGFDVNTEQIGAWENQITELQARLKESGFEGDIIFEYNILRLGKRLDVVILARHMVFSLEFKNGKKTFDPQDARQAVDYAVRLKNFHKESKDLCICPILVATRAEPLAEEQSLGCYSDKVVYLQKENIKTLVPKMVEIAKEYGDDGKIDFAKWVNSPYYPTPIIIETAVAAYSTHNLTEIARSEAGQGEIDLCEGRINAVIAYAKENGKKCVCFVTGVPGAGKTLVGLDVVAKQLAQGTGGLSVYLSGNGPLVEVLREALKRSVKASGKYDNRTDASIEALIQSSYDFKLGNADSGIPTAENVLIFDEAQRVWDQGKMIRKHNGDNAMCVSEPHLLFSIMDRHQDWAVMICLAGLGQDIYDGEVGLGEWFRCGIEEFSEWEMYYSPAIFAEDQVADTDIKTDRNKRMIEGCARCHAVPELHLSTSNRSFRANQQGRFVDYLLNNKPADAASAYEELHEHKYPVYLTRDFHAAKKWVREQARGSERSGVLACSSAQRLRPEGIWVLQDINVPEWFLAPSEDVRSSNMLEIVASEFKVQGLEIDWSVVCWDADLRRNQENDGWECYTFRGTRWNKIKKEEKIRYKVNSYRVLLTRARQGTILFVPRGTKPEEDSTRNSAYYDSIYKYLLSCGIQEI